MECIRESELREVFKEFDKNGDGKITKEELELALVQLGEKPSNSKIDAIISQADTDGNGCIEIDEFLQVLRQQLLNPREERELREVFGVFDKDDDGFISVDDLMTVMHSLGETLSGDAARQMIKEGDVDGDGMISFHESEHSYGVKFNRLLVLKCSLSTLQNSSRSSKDVLERHH
ncbi:EF hand [Ancylostoma ceylanicum]|uniref:EF hand n=1 Tax=Ancylostoma ceylanicum TaxID=53326 RepID=A0A0D6LLZ7_9BILA|nr:EF hand [Ancylostoma ceylanicum]